MVDRSEPLVVTPQACPFVALDGDRDARLDAPDPMHRCFAEAVPKARSMGHQANFCLTPAFTACPIFLDWASRVAADVAPVAARTDHLAALSTTDTAGSADASTDSVRPPWSTLPPWLADPAPAPDPVETAGRRTARVDVDASAAPGATQPSLGAVTGAAALAAAAAPPRASPDLDDDDSDTAAELAASMVRTDLLVGPAPAAPGTDGAADEGTPTTPPWARGRRVPMDAGAPASLGPQTRPGAPPAGPREWEGARRFEAYAARTGSRRPGRPVLIAIGTALVAVALLVVFLLPSLFRGGTAGPSSAPESAGVGDVTRTPRPTSGATLLPAATPIGPEPTPGSYRIKRGDTLSAVARRFKVTVEQLICANNIRNPNSLSTGVTIVIPVETYECPRPTKKPAKTPKG